MSGLHSLDAEYVDESHIQAFAEALRADDALLDHPEQTATPPGTPHPSRIRKITALSDFAPINLKVKRRKKKDKSLDKRNDYMFLLLRWPLLCFILLFTAAEFGCYVLIRQLVNTKEWISAWRGQKGVLRKRLRNSHTYEEWKQAAAALDQYLHFDEWKKVDEDSFYDWMLVKKVRRSLKALREKNDVRGCLGVLETCIRANFAGVESPRLYSETFLGTKDLIESYINEQALALEYIRESPELSIDEKRRFFKQVNTNMGISALCLSGGASFGYYHCGVVKALLDARLLPRVITGTSAGGLVASLACTRTDEELKILLVPALANKITACEESFKVWATRLWKTGARFDSILWARKCTFFTGGSMTFKEAYLRTGRILNISVIPADRHSPTKLLNYCTSPDTVIWTALLASAAVPGVLNPVVLMKKLKDGSIVPWNWGSRFKDGSLRVDIPVQALNLYFNVTHPIVSQVNPHVHLFFFAPRGSAGKPVAHRKGKGWRGNFLLSAAEQALKHQLTSNFKVIRDLELLPQLLGQDWSSVFLQRFDGAVTIWPRTRFWDWFRLLTDPDPPELERMIRIGQIVTWPKLHMIENRAKLENQIYLGRKSVRKALQSKTTRPESSTFPGNTSAPPPTGSDLPLSVDSDAEAAMVNGGRQPLIRSGVDNLRASVIRRKWASPIPDNSKPTSGGRSFFTRLRTRSFQAISSPSSKPPVPVAESADETWSSDSSFEDDVSLETRRYSHLGAEDLRTEGR
ncbi:acyl transferase/acyl hydrolase/lysophospholipase [Mycena floridula]|nr:acyl transferase/acyl hydrolase/lysophospholipase [Mycena floridula]